MLCLCACGLDTFGISDATPDTTGDSMSDTLPTSGTPTSDSMSDTLPTTGAPTSSDTSGSSTSDGDTTDGLMSDTLSTSSTSTSSDTSGRELPGVPELQLAFSPIKQFDFSWAAVINVSHYQLLESPRAGEDFVMIADDIMSESLSVTMPLHLRWTASYVLRACNDIGCTDSAEVAVMDTLASAVGYFKASNTGADNFGISTALSGDGNTLAIGAWLEDSSATGIDGDQNDNVGCRRRLHIYA